jgi:hypothetical protein
MSEPSGRLAASALRTVQMHESCLFHGSWLRVVFVSLAFFYVLSLHRPFLTVHVTEVHHP